MKEHGEAIDWTAVGELTHAPRGLPVEVGAHAGTVEAAIAHAPLVQNRIPPGANWDGADEQDSDSQSYQQLLSEREPGATPEHAATAKPKG
jgi:hypothetical protein